MLIPLLSVTLIGIVVGRSRRRAGTPLLPVVGAGLVGAWIGYLVGALVGGIVEAVVIGGIWSVVVGHVGAVAVARLAAGNRAHVGAIEA